MKKAGSFKPPIISQLKLFFIVKKAGSLIVE